MAYIWKDVGSYMPHLEGIIVFSTCLAITGEVEVAIGCGLAYMCYNPGSRGPVNMLAVWAIFGM